MSILRPESWTPSRNAVRVSFFVPTRFGLLEMSADTWAAIMDDNPGEFAHQINGDYPKRQSLSTVPPNILAALPRLPDDVQYRFLGRHLILHDTRANVIVDRIPYAVHCVNCQQLTCPRKKGHRGHEAGER